MRTLRGAKHQRVATIRAVHLAWHPAKRFGCKNFTCSMHGNDVSGVYLKELGHPPPRFILGLGPHQMQSAHDRMSLANSGDCLGPADRVKRPPMAARRDDHQSEVLLT